jgi:hypothetical protein
LDLHVHTTHSIDGHCSVKEAAEAARARGLNGFAITDHNTVSGHEEAKKLSKSGFIIIPGIEVSSTHGHIVGLGVSEAIPKKLSPSETVERIKEQGGVAIAAHPFSPPRNPNMVYKAKFDAIEVLNSRAIFPSNNIAQRFARINKIPGVGGSDGHRYDEIGMAYTVVDCEPKVDSILRKIQKGETSADGRTLPLPSYLWGVLQKALFHR